MALLLGQGRLNPERLADAIYATFERRKTHPVPSALPDPPEAWARPFAALAKECALPADITPHLQALRSYLKELLPKGFL